MYRQNVLNLRLEYQAVACVCRLVCRVEEGTDHVNEKGFSDDILLV
jgi:hypothetical protein